MLTDPAAVPGRRWPFPLRKETRPAHPRSVLNLTMKQRIRPGADSSNLRLAADIGGTFTDIAVFDERTGKLTFGKALSTPQRLVEGINAGVEGRSR